MASYDPLSIRLADFGLAKKITPDSPDDDIPNGTLHPNDGTRDWAAPEQLSGDGSYDNKVDLWSIGCVVHYLLTSLSPFSDHDANQDLAVIARFKYPHWPRVGRASFLGLNERCAGHFVAVRGISQDANQFLEALIVPDPYVRLSAGAALGHIWINPAGVEMMKMAVRSGNQPLIQLLVKSGTTEVLDMDKLRLAAPGGHLEFVQRVLARPRAAELTDGGGRGAEGATTRSL